MRHELENPRVLNTKLIQKNFIKPCYSSSSRIQSYVREFNPAIYARLKWLSTCAERIAVLSLPINHIIILAPAVT
jgi:hypothetical protein